MEAEGCEKCKTLFIEYRWTMRNAAHAILVYLEVGEKKCPKCFVLLVMMKLK